MDGDYLIRADGERLFHTPSGDADGRLIAIVDGTYTFTEHVYQWGVLAGTTVTVTSIERSTEGTIPRIGIEDGDSRWVSAERWARLRTDGVVERTE